MSRKEKYIDDGHTIYNMDVEGLPHRHRRSDGVCLSKQEKRAAIKAAYKTYLPVVFGLIVCFSLTMLMIYFWLH